MLNECFFIQEKKIQISQIGNFYDNMIAMLFLSLSCYLPLNMLEYAKTTSLLMIQYFNVERVTTSIKDTTYSDSFNKHIWA